MRMKLTLFFESASAKRSRAFSVMAIMKPPVRMESGIESQAKARWVHDGPVRRRGHGGQARPVTWDFGGFLDIGPPRPLYTLLSQREAPVLPTVFAAEARRFKEMP